MSVHELRGLAEELQSKAIIAHYDQTRVRRLASLALVAVTRLEGLEVLCDEAEEDVPSVASGRYRDPSLRVYVVRRWLESPRLPPPDRSDIEGDTRG